MMRSHSRVTHPLSVSYLVIGLVFLGISGSWALRSSGAVDGQQFGWILPLMLVAVGAVGLLAATAKATRGRRSDDVEDRVDSLDSHRPDDSDPIPTYSFGVDDLEKKLERAARSGSTTSTLVEQRDPVDPVDPPDPVDPVDPPDPVDPVDPPDPVDPVDPVDPPDPVDRPGR